MSNRELQIFKFEDHEIRVKMIKGEPWFVIADVCKILEITNVSQATGRLDQDGVCQTEVIDSLGRKQNAAAANEPNLYRLIFRSDKPEAKTFQDWVYNEVLPTIRKTGSYSINPEPVPTQLESEFDFTLHIRTAADLDYAEAVIGAAKVVVRAKDRLKSLLTGEVSECFGDANKTSKDCVQNLDAIPGTKQIAAPCLRDRIIKKTACLQDKEPPTLREFKRHFYKVDPNLIEQEVKRLVAQRLLETIPARTYKDGEPNFRYQLTKQGRLLSQAMLGSRR